MGGYDPAKTDTCFSSQDTCREPLAILSFPLVYPPYLSLDESSALRSMCIDPSQCVHIFVMNQAHVVPVFIFRGNSNIKAKFNIWSILKKMQQCSQTRSRILCIRKELSAHRFVKGISNCVFQQSQVTILVICFHDQKVVVQVIRAISISRDHIPCPASDKRKLRRNAFLFQQLAGFLQNIRTIRTILLCLRLTNKLIRHTYSPSRPCHPFNIEVKSL